ncbi:hypothetical protein F8A86_09360 [Betaproteobacteria bacterium SCN1]|jgi:nitrogen fixation protein FixH|nr:hypothetical protein F8A86_09360 [Betaproteobacteria bacterium SCN1]MBN8761024.1 FixH family protein [Thiobacillus sp.]ODU90499.1 MAG: hypothetical protein ABT21_00120 [Thiobacillus sp. SCN 65-179]OJW36076.1 MAG: hypothetical protein BGO61_09080 [Thiobacillus sp. 65-69]
MNTTFVTLFSGLGAVLVLYALLGLMRTLHPMLRALLAGLIPLTAYFILIVGGWPGLDVAAIHISVFLAAALVLYAITQFRKSSERLHWVPKLLIAFFVGLVFFNAGLLYVSNAGLPVALGTWWLGGNGQTVHSGFSGVVPHGENAARAVSSELARTHRESQAGWRVEVDGLDGTETVRSVVIRAQDRTGLPVDDAQAEIRISRPGAPDSGHTEALRMSAPGVYEGAVSLPGKGRWLLDVNLSRSGETRYHSGQEAYVP